MKIGIFTRTPKNNYGGTLQCLALQNFLLDKGYTVEVIAYTSSNRGRKIAKLKQILGGISIKEIVNNSMEKLYNFAALRFSHLSPLPESLLKKNSEFIKNNIILTEKCDEYTIGELVLSHKFDIVIFGSDKVWVDLGVSQLVCMGEWNIEPVVKFISYAACSGRKVVPRYNREKVKKCLGMFSHISVRDTSTKNLISPYTDKNIEIVVDPTLLYNFHDFKNLINLDCPYILTYILGREIVGGHERILNKLKHRYPECIIVSIVLTNESTDIVKFSDKVYYDAGVGEWVSLIYHSTAVYTDSYHGTLFALKFKKQFVTYYRELSRSSRIIDLKNEFCLKNVISKADDYCEDIELSRNDYDRIDKYIKTKVSHSIKYLENALLS